MPPARIQGQEVVLARKIEKQGLGSTPVLQAAGPDFAPIVVEFARLQKEIEGKRWALAELGGAAPPAL